MRFKQGWKLYRLIPMKCVSVLPDEGFTPRIVDIGDRKEDSLMFVVYCRPKTKGKGHRVMVVCDCERHVPFGRMGQHYPKCKRG